MQAKKFGQKYILRLDKGEEIVSTLKKFCEHYQIKLGIIAGIGATNKITVGLFATKAKEYHSQEFAGDFEIAPLYGNVSTMNNETYLHLHVNFCDKEHKSYGGHLNSAIVSATFEAVIEIIDGQINRKYSEEIGLNLIKL